MARRNVHKRNIRKLGTIGNAAQPSYYVTLPIEHIRNLGWKSTQRLNIRKHGNKLIIEDYEA